MGPESRTGQPPSPTALIRAVLDTNVLISIALPRSRLQPLVEAWKRKRFQLLISEEIFEEYLRVLTYSKFRLSTEDIRQILERELRPYAEWVGVTHPVDLIREDPSDNKFLACGREGRADWIVTGDRHLLRLKRFEAVQIGTPAQFLKVL